MSATVTYTCDKCGKSETVNRNANGNAVTQERFFGIRIELTQISTVRLPKTSIRPGARNTMVTHCICEECARKYGWVVQEQTQEPTIEELFRELIQDEVQQAMEP